VLEALDLCVTAGELLMLIGPNGAGKSTLLGAAAGDLPPAAGQILFKGRPLAQWRPMALARERAVLPQRPSLNLPFTVREVVRLGCLARTESKSRQDDLVEQALAAADADGLADRVMTALSGGEQARANLARVLVQVWPGDDDQEPRLLLLDEPCASLDPHHQHAVCEAIHAFTRNTGAGVVVTMHDMSLAAQYADRIVALKAGRKIADGAPRAVLTRAFVQQCFDVDAACWDQDGSFLVATLQKDLGLRGHSGSGFAGPPVPPPGARA
jgi:iron complex transport system ATP-binding protein